MTHVIRLISIAIGVALVSTVVLAQTARPPAAATSGNTVQWISVVLLIGDAEGAASSGDDIPVAVQKALADVRDFLPFRNYRLYDAALVGPPLPSRVTSARLRGERGQVLDASLSLQGPSGPANVSGPFTLQFTLKEPPPQTAAQASASSRTVMNASVTLDLGETVVVGTSRLQGEKALIVLLTAVPAKR